MSNLFVISEVGVIIILGIPTIAYLYLAFRPGFKRIECLSETISNYSLFNSLYSIFLGMALVTLLVNFNTVQDDTRKEAESIISSARLMSGMSDAQELKQALVNYAASVVEFDLAAIQSGNMSEQASAAFDQLWEKAYTTQVTTKNDENIHQLTMGELSTITKCRMTRRMKCKENLHPFVFTLIVTGYYVMLIKAYFTRISCKRVQFVLDSTMFLMILMVITAIIDLNTPFVGIVNVDTSPFRWALERAMLITKLAPS